ncbi:hypothetical protein [Burkholderia sp. BCC1993]|uniref:hypothetical protein n=1 Tax=Burkholderia sp. BCC1993 TaxID=2817444 RepID=UPI002AAF1060|nr:hypothetical protein [Burkholderia sp. BCC1993]
MGAGMKSEVQFVVLVSHVRGVKQEPICSLFITGPTPEYRHALTSALGLYTEPAPDEDRLPAEPCVLLALVSLVDTPDTVGLRLVVDVRGRAARGFWMHDPIPGGGWLKTGLSECVPVAPDANAMHVVRAVWSARQWVS